MSTISLQPTKTKITFLVALGRLTVRAVLLVGLNSPFGVIAAEETPPDFPGLTFGSQAVLESCWTPAQLAGAQEGNALAPGPRPTVLPPAPVAGRSLPPLPAPLRNSIRAVQPRGGEKVIALTFDLCARKGENSGYDAALVNYLRQQRIKATFYPSAVWMRRHPEQTLQLMSDPLFELGNHSGSHLNLALLSGATLENEVLAAEAQYQELRAELISRPCAAAAGSEEWAKIPETLWTFRFPYGRCHSEALHLLAETGLPAVQWSIVTADSAPGRTAEQIAGLILKRARPGAIIVGHANGRGRETAKALPLFIPALQQQGYRLVTVSELLRFGPAVSAEDCYEQKPGDNREYDRLFQRRP